MAVAVKRKPAQKAENLLEFVTNPSNASLRVDREAGIIRGVKILGTESANGRTYTREAIRDAKHLYEGVRVNVDHPAAGRGNEPRSYRDRLGHLEAVTDFASGLYGELHFNPKHRLAEQLMWDAEHTPQNLGLSHNVSGRTTRKNGRVVVEAILTVHSVDLVADPATTAGLFEHHQTQEDHTVDPITIEAVRGDTAIMEALTQQIAAPLKTEVETLAAKLKTAEASLKESVAKVDAFEAKAALAIRTDAIDKALTEAKLPKEVVTDLFKSQLMEAEDAKAVAALIEDRKVLAGHAAASGGGPKSQSQHNESGNQGATGVAWTEGVRRG